MEISQNFGAFSEYKNFKALCLLDKIMFIFRSLDLERMLIWQIFFMKNCYLSPNKAPIWCGSCWKSLKCYLHYLGPAVLRCFVTYSITIFNFGNTKSITHTGTKSFLKSNYCFDEPNNMLKVKYFEKVTKFEKYSLKNCSWLLIIA